VRILGTGGELRGLGCRLAENRVLTCAHVIAQAPAEAVLVDAPFADSERRGRPIKARGDPQGWFPLMRMGRTDTAISDLAVLRLEAPLPGPGRSVRLDPGISLTGHPLLSYCGIQGHAENLVPIEGQVGADIANGRYCLLTGAGYRIEPGCSGAPVLSAHTGTLLGLIAQDKQDPNIRAGFLIPAAHLRQILEQTGIISPISFGLGYLRRWIDSQLRGAGSRLADQVSRFVDYYAGTPDRPMPFAGRGEALFQLDNWLDSWLATGGAGLGKSALLLYWIARLLGHGEAVTILFLPVSIRFDIADELRGLRLLYAQLAVLFNDLQFPEGTKPDQDDYRDRIATGWERIANRTERRFVLVTDGADEASGNWLTKQVLPYCIPANLAILLAARYHPGQRDGRTWLKAFDFALGYTRHEPLDLRPLSQRSRGRGHRPARPPPPGCTARVGGHLGRPLPPHRPWRPPAHQPLGRSALERSGPRYRASEPPISKGSNPASPASWKTPGYRSKGPSGKIKGSRSIRTASGGSYACSPWPAVPYTLGGPVGIDGTTRVPRTLESRPYP